MQNASRKSWTVKEESICTELLELLKVSPEECGLMQALKGVAEGVVDEMVTEFHTTLLAHENTQQYFESVTVERVGKAVKLWYLDLFSGQYDFGYAHSRLIIGQTHVRIGLPVRYPLAMLEIIHRHSDRILVHAADPQAARRAFNKILALDIAVFNQAYEDNQLKHLADLVGGERLARTLLTRH